MHLQEYMKIYKQQLESIYCYDWLFVCVCLFVRLFVVVLILVHLNMLLTHTYLQVCQLCVRIYATWREEMKLISVFNREKGKEMNEGKG